MHFSKNTFKIHKIGMAASLIAILTVAATANSFASDSPEKIYEEDEVVVTATRTPEAESKAPGRTEVITKEQIKSSGAATVAEALTQAGVAVSSYGGASGAANLELDGASAKQTLVLVNGIPVNTGCVGSADLSYYPTAGIKRIEITHGPLSALYGTNALGGVVNIITDLTGTNANQISLTGGNHDYGGMNVTMQREKYGLAIGGLYTDGYQTHSATTNQYLMGQYDLLQTKKNQITMNLLYKAKNNQAPGSLTVNGFEETRSLDVSGKSTINDWTLEYKLFNQTVDNRYLDPSSLNSHHQTATSGIDMAGQTTWGSNTLLGGLTSRQDAYTSTDSGEHTLQNNAFYAQDVWSFTPSLALTSGLRLDTGNFSSPPCPRISLVKAVSKDFSLKLGYGKAFQAPTVDDLYWQSTGTWTYIGDSNLKPETADRYDISAEWNHVGASCGINLYTMDISDMIDWAEVGTNIWRVSNVNKAQTRGICIYGKKEWNHWISSGLQYNWLDTQKWDSQTQSYDISLNRFGKNQITANVDLNYYKFLTHLDWQYHTDRSYPGEDLSDYDVINLNIQYRVNGGLNYELAINNLGDRQYVINKDSPMPGREYYLTANYSFK